MSPYQYSNLLVVEACVYIYSQEVYTGDPEANVEKGLFLFLTPSPNNGNYYGNY